MPEISKAEITSRLIRLRSKGYKDVWVDDAGCICIKVDTDATRVVTKNGKQNPVPLYTEDELFRQVWGVEWPIVRSSRPDAKYPPIDQLQFSSRFLR